MKPQVVCLMASSVDGRTLHSRWRPKGTGAALFEQVHDELAGDAWLVGRVTGQEFAKGRPYPTATKETFPREPRFANRNAKAYGVVLDAHGKIFWGRSDIGGESESWSYSRKPFPTRTWLACAAMAFRTSLPVSWSSISPLHWTSSTANSA
jgi:hypothetical protein